MSGDDKCSPHPSLPRLRVREVLVITASEGVTLGVAVNVALKNVTVVWRIKLNN